MRTSQYVKFEYILDRIHRDYGFSNISIPDVKDDMWDVVGLLGIVQAFEDKIIKDAEIVDFRCPLPMGFYTLQPVDMAIRESSTRIPFRHLSDKFYLDQEGQGNSVNMSLIAGQAAHYDPNDPDAQGTLYVGHIPEGSLPEHYTYRMTRDYIYVGKRTTKIDIAYTAFPVDDNGAPMIADNPKYLRAVTSYLGERLAFRLWTRGKISDKVYDKIFQDYCFAAGSAETHAVLPTNEQMENLINRSKQLLKGSDHFMTGFSSLGNP